MAITSKKGFDSRLGFDSKKGFTSMVGIGVVPIPESALVFYAFNQGNLDNAQTEQVNKQSVLYRERASNSNIDQSSTGSVITFVENEAAFNIGRGLVTQGKATTLIENSGLVGTTSLIINWSTFGAIDSVQQSNVFSSVNSVTFLSASSQNFIQETISGIMIGDEFALSCDIESISGSISVDNAISMQTPGNFTRQYSYNGVDVADSFLIPGPGNIVLKITATVADTGFFRIGCGTVSNATGSTTVSLPQLVTDLVPSSFIQSPIGSGETREPDNNELPCFTEKGVWDTRQTVAVGNSNSGDFINGIADSGLFTWASMGTFIGLMAADDKFLGAIFSNKQSAAVVTDVANVNTGTLTLLRGSFDDLRRINPVTLEVNLITVDFVPSDYFTGSFAADTAVLDTLLDDAGYDVPSFPAAEQWPVTDFELELNFKYRGTDESFPFYLNIVLDGNNSIIGQHQISNGNWFFQVKIAGVTESVAKSVMLVVGDDYKVVLTVDSVQGIKISINGEASGFNADRTSVPLGATMQLFSTIVLASHMNTECTTVTLSPI